MLAVVSLLNGCSTVAGVWGQQDQATQIQDQLLAIDGQAWVVGTHLVTVSPDALVSGSPSVGDRVGVSGRRTASGELVIDDVQVVADAQPAATPAEVRAEAAGAGAPSAQPAPDTPPHDTVNSPEPQARPRVPESEPADHGNQADKADKAHKADNADKSDNPGKGRKGN